MMRFMAMVLWGLVAVTAAEARGEPLCRATVKNASVLVIEPMQAGRARALAEFRLPVRCDAGAEGTWSLSFENATAHTKGRPETDSAPQTPVAEAQPS